MKSIRQWERDRTLRGCARGRGVTTVNTGVGDGEEREIGPQKSGLVGLATRNPTWSVRVRVSQVGLFKFH